MKFISHFHPYVRVTLPDLLVVPVAEIVHEIMDTRIDPDTGQQGHHPFIISSETFTAPDGTYLRLVLLEDGPYFHPAYLVKEAHVPYLLAAIEQMTHDRAAMPGLVIMEWQAQITIDLAERQAALDAKYPDGHAIAFCA